MQEMYINCVAYKSWPTETTDNRLSGYEYVINIKALLDLAMPSKFMELEEYLYMTV